MSDAVIYLDHHATTPVDPRVLEAVVGCMRSNFGNAASSVHRAGRDAQRALEEARRVVARCLGAISPQEVLFTSGATESNNLAILGIFSSSPKPAHFITTAIEHASVLATTAELQRLGHFVTVLPVDAQGHVDPAAVRAALRPDTRLVSVMLCNHEVGAVQPVAEVGAICRQHEVLFHCDAVQGIGKVPFDVEAMHVDLATVSGHKLYGPKGIGALYVRRGSAALALRPQSHGGGQERGLRSGTANVPGAVGLAKAMELCADEAAIEVPRLRTLRDRLWQRLCQQVEGLHLHGPALDGLLQRHPGNLNLSVEGLRAADLMFELPGLAMSAASACSGASGAASQVLQAMGVSQELAAGALRIGIGRFSTEAEIDTASAQMVRAIDALRASGAQRVAC